MRRRNLRLLGVVILVGLVALCAYLARPYPPVSGVSYANVERIKPGMSRAEVIAILGIEPQQELHGREGQITPNTLPEYHKALMWSDAECDIWVYLDREGKVIAREGVGGRGSPTWFDRLRRRLGV